jgi:hypothetical protein
MRRSVSLCSDQVGGDPDLRGWHFSDGNPDCLRCAKRRHAYQMDPSSLTSLGSILPGIEPEGAKPQSLAPIRR